MMLLPGGGFIRVPTLCRTSLKAQAHGTPLQPVEPDPPRGASEERLHTWTVSPTPPPAKKHLQVRSGRWPLTHLSLSHTHTFMRLWSASVLHFM
ncbi:hypothetical protein EYF80_059450 [Liparis tanakae]|uniref:Uncharacterized protein n=1 Tax=Liparis tanakae TaxID=230148 RepID=A0A4Z2ENM4_9TELE|nr:hypothetical protein EYF80_059450 [Liparis tanakae]